VNGVPRSQQSKDAKKSAPLTRDAEATRSSILDSAEDEFAANGLLGARTEAIAAKTGVTKAMIYYYFQSKEQLYEAVLERAFLRRLQIAQSINLAAMSPDQALERCLRELLIDVSKNKNLSAIFFYEAVQNKGKYYNKFGAMSLYGVLAGILEQGVAKGNFRQLDPMHTAVNIVGASVFYFCTRENIKHLWAGKNLLSSDMVEWHIKEAIELIMNGVRASDG
jgi:AcrR family transcriptional regulator